MPYLVQPEGALFRACSLRAQPLRYAGRNTDAEVTVGSQCLISVRIRRTEATEGGNLPAKTKVVAGFGENTGETTRIACKQVSSTGSRGRAGRVLRSERHV